ncbi:hypothetical protein [Zoogloea dura]|jgi:hypothetical protein|uniref:Uncharacterized protein n=1 Tax=Zoogloea dura TaxID=2728840 RepID=A0A848G922_9RHOO|nr:hypothetical protein [Zoogloea dura]NML27346.1 hypothetical protein [Zoogloea dura]
MKKQFTEQQLTSIVEEAMVYMCACPAQVAEELRRLRDLYAYQVNCESTPNTDPEVHRIIARAAVEAHAIMEACMDEILTLEGWDRETLVMPEGLRKIRDDLINE